MTDHYGIVSAGEWSTSGSGFDSAWATLSGGTIKMEPPTAEDVAFLDANTPDYFATDLESAGQFCRRLDMGPNYYTYAFAATFTVDADIDIGGDETDLTRLGGTIEGAASLYIGTSVEFLPGVDFSGYEVPLILDCLGPATLTTNGVTLPPISLYGYLEAVDPATMTDFEMVAGSGYNDGGQAHTVLGDLTIVGSTGSEFVSTGTWALAGSGIVWMSSLLMFAKVIAGAGGGVVSTFTSNIHVRAFGYGSGTVTADTDEYLEVRPSADDFWTSGAGTVSLPSVRIVLSASRWQAGAIRLSNVTTLMVFPYYMTSGDFTLTAGTIDVAASILWVYAPSAGRNMTLAITGDLACGAVKLGDSAAYGTGKIAFGTGTHAIAGLQKYASDGPAGSVCDFGSASITLTGVSPSIDGGAATPIAFRNTAGKVHGGTLTNLAVDAGDNALIAFQSTHGSGNSNVTRSQVLAHHHGRMSA